MTANNNVMPQIEKLIQLIECNQFEIVDFDSMTEKKDGTDYRIVYLMNDAVESFIVLKNARYTGTYIQDYAGELMWDLHTVSDGYALRIQQGESHIMLFFDDCIQEVNLYNYGHIGHFWVKGYEYMRIIEYQVSIIKDKLDYLGPEYCNDTEKKLALLKYFPPLNYVSWPSAPEKYIVPMDNPYEVSYEAVEYLKELAQRAEDTKMAEYLDKYIRKPTIKAAKKLALRFICVAHEKITDLIMNEIKKAAKEYPLRYDNYFLPDNGENTYYYEEPFLCQHDDITFKTYEMCWHRKNKRRYTEIKVVNNYVKNREY